MTATPWLSSAATALAGAIAAAYRHHTGRDLVAAQPAGLVAALYATPMVVLAHDGGDDPRFIYANQVAQMHCVASRRGAVDAAPAPGATAPRVEATGVGHGPW